MLFWLACHVDSCCFVVFLPTSTPTPTKLRSLVSRTSRIWRADHTSEIALPHKCSGMGTICSCYFKCLSYITMSNDEKRKPDTAEDDDEPDEWDQRINKTGCAEENLKLQLCHADTGDWRQCVKEMKEFKECWDRNQNNLRTSTIDNEDKEI